MINSVLSSLIVLFLLDKFYLTKETSHPTFLQKKSESFFRKSKKNKCLQTPLNWNQDPWLPFEDEDDSAQRLSIPSLTQPFYKEVNDVRATVSANNLEFILSTNGNWRSALAIIIDEVYFNASSEHPLFSSPTTKFSYFLTTSPPISVAQLTTGLVKVGNVLYVDAQPHLVVAPGAVLNSLASAELTVDSTRTALIKTYGNVILKRSGSKKIRSFWDLKKIKPGRFASSDPAEGGSFKNYRTSVFEIAKQFPENLSSDAQEVEATAENLQFRLFDKKRVSTIGPPMHNSVPHQIANKKATAGLIFLNRAVTAMRNNPGVFSAVYLASDKTGETDDPDVIAQGQVPLTGNRVGTFSFVHTNVELNSDQTNARDAFIRAILSDTFTTILHNTGLRRP